MSDRIAARKLPSKQVQTGHDYYTDVNTDDFTYDTNKVLPEGSEVKAYLLVNETIKVLFLIEEDGPVSLKITPCASAVESSVLYKSISDSKDYEDDPLFEEQVKPTNPAGIQLYSYVGSEAHTFQRSVNSTGIYTVFLRPIESDTYVKFFLRLKKFARDSTFYPSLPRNSAVRADSIRRKSFTVSWNRSQDETPYGNIITYCVSVSAKRSSDTYCSLMSYMFGDKLPVASKSRGFFFAWEDEVLKIFQSKARPVKKVKPREIHYTCVGTNTKYIYTQARPGKTYYINVYAINKRTNMSSAYKKLEVTTKKRKKRDRIRKLRDGKLQELEFKKSKLRFDFKYDLKNTSDLFLAVHSCTGKVTLKVTRGSLRGESVLVKKVKRSSMFTLKDLKADTYFIDIVSRQRDVPKTARLVVSKKQSKLRYPILPRKSEVFLVDNSTTSNSLTIGWRVTKSRRKFCIYQKEILARRKRRRNYNQCSNKSQSPVVDSKKVKCMIVRHQKPNMVLNHQIRNLKSNTLYQFDVVIQLGKGYSLLYNSLQTATKQHL
ncbi:unnamed protein product [Mytilus coruscus]|uniref:Protein NDNF n=1 Tax=Mytilus coruscus TaxID=42192 RepID=A0A6J8D7B4_MYTCO|nr:unnamed protein product [Mytilus coruscus]